MYKETLARLAECLEKAGYAINGLEATRCENTWNLQIIPIPSQRKNESRALSMDGVSEPFNWVDLSDTQNKPEKAE